MEDNYYFRIFLYDEVKDNVEYFKKFVNLLVKSLFKFEFEYNKLIIEKYIW